MGGLLDPYSIGFVKKKVAEHPVIQKKGGNKSPFQSQPSLAAAAITKKGHKCKGTRTHRSASHYAADLQR